MKRKIFSKRVRGLFSLVMLLCMTISSVAISSQAFAADDYSPKNLTAKHNDRQKRTVVQFNKVNKAESYNVYRSAEVAGEYQKIQSLKKNRTYAVDSYLDLKTQGTLKSDYLYFYKVSAVVNGQEQEPSNPVPNQEVTEEVEEEAAAAGVELFCFFHSKHCDMKHSGRNCNNNKYPHDSWCDKNHNDGSCNNNKCNHGQWCDKNHSGNNCNENKWCHDSKCDENHSGHNCNNNWNHGEWCDKNHSGKHCNENKWCHDKWCDKNHGGKDCNENKWCHDSKCDENHSGHNCNNNWSHGKWCDKNHSGKNCNENKWCHEKWCDKNHNGKDCNENKWCHDSKCDENHSGHNCNNNWKHHEDCDKNHSGKDCNQNNHKEKWDAVKNVCITETEHHWLKLTWESMGENAEYKIFRAVNKCNDYQSGKFKEIARVKGSTSYNDIKLDHNTTYCYKVMVKRPEIVPSYTIETVSSSNINKFTVCKTTKNPSIKAIATSECSTKVTWTNVKSDSSSTRYATSYTLYRSTTNNIHNATAINVNGKQDGSDIVYADSPLNDCTTYYYWVKANYGQWSSWVSPRWGPACTTTPKKKVIGAGLTGRIKNKLVCGCIPTRYYGAQIYLGKQHPNTLDYTHVRVFIRNKGSQYGGAYKTLNVSQAKYMCGAFGYGYYLDECLSYKYLNNGTYEFAIQAVGKDSHGREVAGKLTQIGCVCVTTRGCKMYASYVNEVIVFG